MELTGTLKELFEEKTFGAKGFRKREVVLSTKEQYPQLVLIEFTQEKCDLLNSFGVGQDVTIAINIRGREWINPAGESKYFNSILGWRISGVTGAAVPAQKPAEENEPDDLPF
jgi:hypothetical protein